MPAARLDTLRFRDVHYVVSGCGGVVEIWRIIFFAAVLIAALVKVVDGHLGSGLFWGLLAAFALLGELIRRGMGRRGSLTLVFIQAIVFSFLLVAVGVGLIVAATLAPSEEERNSYVGGAVLVAPLAALVCWATVAGYRRVRRIQFNSGPQRSGSDVYAGLVAQPQATQPPDPQRLVREKRKRLFFGIATVGWLIGLLGQTFAAEWAPDSAGVAALIGLALMAGGALAGGWSSVWVFKEKAPPDDEGESAR